jgi:hypothetical protein
MKPKLSTSTPAFNNINVNGRVWKFEEFCMKGEYQLWTAHYWCPDGDGIELYIADNHFELSCFSGIVSSVIKMSDLDLTYMQDKVKDLDFRQPFVIQAIKVADYFCQLFCEFKDVSDYKDV